LLAVSASFRLFSYLVGQLQNPFSAPNQPHIGLFNEILEIEKIFDGWSWLAFLVLAIFFLYSKKGQLTNHGHRRWQSLLALFLLLVGSLIRLIPLLNPEWLTLRNDYDEGVHLMAAHLTLNGHIPYKDFFFAQPPFAILGLIPAALLGGDSTTAIWLGRFTSIIWATGAGWLVWLVGRRMGGAFAGIIALLVLQLDGIGIAISRQILLEWQTNFFNLLGLWAFLRFYDRTELKPTDQIKFFRNWEIWLAGGSLAAAALTRLNGVILTIALILFLLFIRHIRQTLTLLVTLALSFVALISPFLLLSGTELVKQVFFFQLLRASDGISQAERFSSFAYNPAPYKVEALSIFTLLLVVFGLVGWLLNDFNNRVLIPIALWGSLTLFFFLFSPTFFVHYFVSLIPVLSLVAGGNAVWLKFAWKRKLWPKIGLVAGLFLLLPAFTGQSVLYGNGGLSEGPREISNFIKTVTSRNTEVQTFNALFNFAAQRPLPVSSNNRLLVDSYGGLQYEAARLRDKNLFALTGDYIQGSRISSNRRYILNSDEAQNFLLEIYYSAGLVVLDERGRDYTSTKTEQALKDFSVLLVANQILSGYANNQQGVRQLANGWLARNLPRNSKIWIEPGTPTIPAQLTLVVGLDSWKYSPDWYRQQGFDYILLSSEAYGRYFKQPEKSKDQIGGYQKLFEAGHIATFRSGTSDFNPIAPDGSPERLELISLVGTKSLLNLSPIEVNTQFENGLILESYAVKRENNSKLLPLNIQLHKTDNNQNLEGLKFFVQLLDSNGSRVAGRDSILAVGQFNSEDWPKGAVISLDADLPLPDNLATGSYKVIFGIYQEKDGKRLKLTGKQGNYVDIGQVEIK
jgi:4-amino-4-deoxy-L-arabinose transferase-like glycosyltransferase